MNRGGGSNDQTNSSQNRNITGNNNSVNNISTSSNFVTLISINYNTNTQFKASANHSQYHQRHPAGEGGLYTASVSSASSASSSSSILSSGGRTATYGNATGIQRKKIKLKHTQGNMDPDYL